MEKRVENAIEVFLKAIDKGTLAKGTCVACAVGNLVAHGLGQEITVKNGFISFVYESDPKSNYLWSYLFQTFEGRQDVNSWFLNDKKIKSNIECTDFTWQELAKIEYAFETNTKIDSSEYYNHTESEILDDQIKGLEAVIEVMLSFSNDTKTDVKEVFTKRVLELKN